MKHIQYLFVGITTVFYLILPTQVFARVPKESYSTATLAQLVVTKTKDTRKERLENFLQSVHSPMADSAGQFIEEADRLQLDWKLIAAISGNESYFGRNIPLNSHNAWGWGIWTGQSYGIQFRDWETGITKVSEGIKHQYVDKGATTVEMIGKRYASDPQWSNKVRHFMNLIDTYKPYQKDERLLALLL